MNLGKKIEKLRKAREMTLQQLADKAEMSKAYLWQIEHGRSDHQRPGAHILYNIATALETTVADLLEDPVRVQAGAMMNLSKGLKRLIEDRKKQGNPIPEDDIRMLANIRYRGRRPEAKEDWEYIYESIKRTLGD